MIIIIIHCLKFKLHVINLLPVGIISVNGNAEIGKQIILTLTYL